MSHVADTTRAERVTVPVWNMKRIGVRPSIREYLRQIWKLRHFIRLEAQGRAFQNARGTMLGRIWIIVEPFLNAAVYLVIFGLLLKTGRGIDNFLGYLMVGSIVFTVTSQSFAPAAGIITSGKSLIESFTFPRATLVFSFSYLNFLNALPGYGILFVAIIILPTHALPFWTWLLFPAAIFLQLLFNIGLSFFVAAVTSYVPDLKFVWKLVGSFWFLGSGIFFSIERWVAHPTVAAFMEANPAYVLLTICRDLLLYHNLSSLSHWIYFAIWAVGLFIVGFVVFWRNEEHYGEHNDR